jgi:8-oxo-dGTP pyrophosphatase MutT (NUDIX family)
VSEPFAFDVPTVRERAAVYLPRAKPADHPSVWAATALVVVPGAAGPDVAFIQRPERAGDRWSGQVALPGGKRDPEDADAIGTAVRETREEVGVDLPEPVGRLDDVKGRVHAGIVATYVFALDDRPELRPDPAEVQAAVWVPLRTLLSAEAAFRYTWGRIGRFPAIRHEDFVIWGLTHRILGSFAKALGVKLPPVR